MSPADFLRAHHDEILAAWGERTKSLSHARTLPGLVLLDHMPHFLEELAARLDGSPSRLFEAIALEHAVARSQQGIPFREVVAEYAILREVVAKAYAAQGGGALPAIFDQTIADAAAETTELFKRAGQIVERGEDEDGQSRHGKG